MLSNPIAPDNTFGMTWEEFKTLPRASVVVNVPEKAVSEEYSWENKAQEIKIRTGEGNPYISFISRDNLPTDLDFLSRNARPQSIAVSRVKAAVMVKKMCFFLNGERVDNEDTKAVEEFYKSAGLTSKVNEKFLDDLCRQGAMCVQSVFDVKKGKDAGPPARFRFVPYSAYRIPVKEGDMFETEVADGLFKLVGDTDSSTQVIKWDNTAKVKKEASRKPFIQFPMFDPELNTRDSYNKAQTMIFGVAAWEDYYVPTWYSPGYLDDLRQWIGLSKLGKAETDNAFKPIGIYWIYAPLIKDLENSENMTLKAFQEKKRDFQNIKAQGSFLVLPTNDPEKDGTITPVDLKGNFKNYMLQLSEAKEAICSANKLPYDVLFKSQGTSINNDTGERLRLGNDIWYTLEVDPVLSALEEFYKQVNSMFLIDYTTTFEGSKLNREYEKAKKVKDSQDAETNEQSGPAL